MQAYSDPKRENDPHALPDIEVFFVSLNDCLRAQNGEGWLTDALADDREPADLVGYFWQSCFPGCLPDGEPMGPFGTEAEALTDAQENSDDGYVDENEPYQP